MCKRFVPFLLLALVSAAPVFAAESPVDYCTAEAKDAGIEDAEELRNYVADCLEAVRQDSADGNVSSEEPMTEGHAGKE